MTYCLGIKTRTGLVALADTRLTSGSEVTINKKISIHEVEHHSLFIMTSGLRSVRDKAITYFREVLSERDANFNKLYKAVNAFGEQVRRVAREDKMALGEAGLAFNLFAIVGGQLEDDDEHKLYLLYPEGNWIEVGPNTPFFIIGNSGYGTPILRRGLKYETPLPDALKIGFLSFDSTRVSANDVDFPIDVAVYERDSFHMIEHRFEKEDVEQIAHQWGALLVSSVQRLPSDWMAPIFEHSRQPAE
ncbi:peptidase [Siphonobacter aquaeclarae]|uniref:Putative proteasome-type protease n=1 Tax=Siphonobacter aquaeclarae TaxID=563176 RepID=A0A1G9STP8_9BACT|nr:peptidase [Siphonobacter aquaeclarae]SDM38771.1 putative proteasome-type protease [Siphonobacter aquaeclarae]